MDARVAVVAVFSGLRRDFYGLAVHDAGGRIAGSSLTLPLLTAQGVEHSLPGSVLQPTIVVSGDGAPRREICGQVPPLRAYPKSFPVYYAFDAAVR